MMPLNSLRPLSLALAIALIFNMVIAPLVAPTHVLAGPTTHAVTFEENINLINERLTDLISHVREMRELGKSEDLVTAEISATCTKLQEELKIPHIEFAQLLTEHIGTLLSMSIARSAKVNYRENALVDHSEVPSTKNNSASTIALAASLNNTDLSTLALTARINAAVTTQIHHNFTVASETDFNILLGLMFVPLSVVPAYLIGVHYDSFIVGVSSWIVANIGSVILNSSENQSYIKNEEKRRDQNFNNVIEALASQLQSALGEAATPLIAAIRTGDVEALRSAACQYHLTPQPLLHVRVESEAADAIQAEQQADSGAPTQEAALQQRQHEI